MLTDPVLIDNFKTFVEQNGLKTLQPVDSDQDAFFSWSRCDCCRTADGGMRHDCHGYVPVLNLVLGKMTVCVDCVEYAQSVGMGG